MSNWNSQNRHKYLLQYHVILVCKYRKKLFLNRKMTKDIKKLSYEICSKNNIAIKCMETDKDHIHYMIELEPTISVSKVIKLVKSYTTYHIWKKYNSYLKKSSGRKKLSGPMVILYVQLVMYLKQQ